MIETGLSAATAAVEAVVVVMAGERLWVSAPKGRLRWEGDANEEGFNGISADYSKLLSMGSRVREFGRPIARKCRWRSGGGCVVLGYVQRFEMQKSCCALELATATEHMDMSATHQDRATKHPTSFWQHTHSVLTTSNI